MSKQERNCRWLAIAGLLFALMARADGLKIGNVAVASRDAKTALVTLDIAWSNSWRHGTFHDAAWVFFKTKDAKGNWQPVRLAASKVVNPDGFSQGKDGTALDFVVPGGDDGFVGMFVRRAADGAGEVTARGVTVVIESGANIQQPAPEDLKSETRNLPDRRSLGEGGTPELRAFGVEMVYVAEGPYSLGSGGVDLNRFYKYSDPGQNLEEGDQPPPPTPAYRVEGPGAIPTGRQMGKLWAVSMTPPDKGEIPAAFPNGYAGFYCMRYPELTQGLYAGFLNTLSEAEAKPFWHPKGHGIAIKRTDGVYVATKPDGRCPWLSWADCTAFAAWAGLRPMTELEFEKAIRGPMDPEPREMGLSYWGLSGINAGDIYERLVSAGNAAGLRFQGAHGRGTLTVPADWPAASGVAYRGNYLKERRYSFIGHLGTSGRSHANSVTADRNGNTGDYFGGWRGARSAPGGDPGVRPVSGWVALGKASLTRLASPFKADGVQDDWGKEPLAILNEADSVFPVVRRFFVQNQCANPWRGAKDTSVKIYLGTDGTALCVAAEVIDDKHVNTQGGGGISGADSLQMGLVNATGAVWNVVLALTTNGVVFHQYEGPDDALSRTAERAVVRDEAAGLTRYEVRLPLTAVGLKSGEVFGFNCMVIDSDDGKELHHWLELASGMAYPPKPARYPRFTLE